MKIINLDQTDYKKLDAKSYDLEKRRLRIEFLKLQEDVIKNNMYEKNLNSINNSKNIVLNEFNLINRIDKIIDNYEANNQEGNYEKITVYDKRHFEKTGNFAKLAFKVDSTLKKISNKLENYYI